MLMRCVTSVFLLGMYIAFLLVQGWFARILFMLVSCMCMYELYKAFHSKGMKPISWLCISYPPALLCAYAAGAKLGVGESLLLPLMLVFSMLSLVVIVNRKEADYLSLSATMFSMVYPGMMMALEYPLLDIADPGMRIIALILAFWIAFAGDIAALFVGLRFGKRKLCPRISPKKTVEGAVGGLCASVIFAVAVNLIGRNFVPAMPPVWHFALLGLIAGICSQCGDLTASIVKRYCGVKDYSTILPGHGGVMDRFDGAMFNIVCVYIYFRFLLKM